MFAPQHTTLKRCIGEYHTISRNKENRISSTDTPSNQRQTSSSPHLPRLRFFSTTTTTTTQPPACFLVKFIPMRSASHCALHLHNLFFPQPFRFLLHIYRMYSTEPQKHPTYTFFNIFLLGVLFLCILFWPIFFCFCVLLPLLHLFFSFVWVGLGARFGLHDAYLRTRTDGNEERKAKVVECTFANRRFCVHIFDSSLHFLWGCVKTGKSSFFFPLLPFGPCSEYGGVRGWGREERELRKLDIYPSSCHF